MVGIARAGGRVSVLDTYTSTHKEFLIANRIHLNTLENTIIFLPLLWVATLFSTFPVYAASVGALWLLARLWYAFSYRRDAAKRAPALFLSLLCLLVLVGLSSYGFYLNW
jgi:uncharacterized MAPEG superfamily protein